jgi:outer membrane protein assembly factor BamB
MNGAAASAVWTRLSNTTHVNATTLGEKVSVNVPGLSNGLCYAFQVVAFNAVGEGNPSEWSAVVVPGGVPDAPRVAATVADRSATIRWTVPRNNGRRLTEYRITMHRAITNFPEGSDATSAKEEDWVVRTPSESRVVAVEGGAAPEGAQLSYLWSHWTNPPHPIDNGESVYFAVEARNAIGVGIAGTHDDGTDASLVTPSYTAQQFATSLWRDPVEKALDRANPGSWPRRYGGGRNASERTQSLSPPTLSAFEGQGLVFACNNVEYSAQRSSKNGGGSGKDPVPEAFSNSEVTVGQITAWDPRTGRMIFRYTSPQFEPFADGRTVPCPSIDVRTGIAFAVSQTSSPKNTHVYALAANSTPAFFSELEDMVGKASAVNVAATLTESSATAYAPDTRAKLMAAGVYDFQDRGSPYRVDIIKNETLGIEGETDLVFNFSRTHAFPVLKPWTVDMATQAREGAAAFHWNAQAHRSVVGYMPPLRSAPVIASLSPTSPSVAFFTSSDGFLYAYDVASLVSAASPSVRSGGTAGSAGVAAANFGARGASVLRFRSDQCDFASRVVNTSWNATWTQDCGCPGLSVPLVSKTHKLRFTSEPVVHEHPIGVFTLFAVTMDDGGLPGAVHDPAGDLRRRDIRPNASVLVAVNITTMLTGTSRQIYRADKCVTNSSWVEAGLQDETEDADLAHIKWLFGATRTEWRLDTDKILASKLAANVTTGLVHLTPTPAQGILFVSTDSSLTALNVSTGGIVWRRDLASRIVDVYVAPGAPRPGDPRAVFVRTFDRRVRMMRHDNGVDVWSYLAGVVTFSRPVRGADYNSTSGDFPKDSYYVQSIDGTTHAVVCPVNAHLVLDRLVYVCPEMTLVRPTSRDVCEELESPCVRANVAQGHSAIRPKGFWPGRPGTEFAPQFWENVSASFPIGAVGRGVGEGSGVYLGEVGSAGGTGITHNER